MTRKIVLLGSAESTRDLAPFDDPSYEIWGLAWRYKDHPRMDRCFEIHSEDHWGAYAGDLYKAWLKEPKSFDGSDSPVTVYVRPEVQKKYRACKPYPIDDAVNLMGHEYFASSFAYMLALAILEQPEEIAVYGIDLASDEEYAYQRPNAEYLLGIARALGIKITIPWQSALLTAQWVYGKERPPEQDPMVEYFKNRLTGYDKQISDMKADIFTLNGAKHEIETFLQAYKVRDRGALGGGRG